MKRRLYFAVLAFLAFWPAASFSQQPATGSSSGATIPVPAGAPTIDQSLEMKSVSAPRISPDGRFVVYEMTRTNWEENAFERDLWLADTASGQSIRLTSAKRSSYDAKWSPDGKWIAFLSDRPPVLSGLKKDDKVQLYVMAAAGGEARELTRLETGVTAYEWSPDSRTIAFTSVDPDSKARKDRDERYGEIQIISSDYAMTHLWQITIPSPESTQPPEPHRLTEGNDFTVGSFAWSPDGARHRLFGATGPGFRLGRYGRYLHLRCAQPRGEEDRGHAGAGHIAAVVT